MICEKCGGEIDRVVVNMFDYDGADKYEEHFLIDTDTGKEDDTGAVYFETDSHWTGLDLSEEEMRETIECPKCGKYPFVNRNIQAQEVIRVIMWKDELK